MKRELREDKLLETVSKIQRQIESRFKDSGLATVAAEVVKVTQESLERANRIRRPVTCGFVQKETGRKASSYYFFLRENVTPMKPVWTILVRLLNGKC